MTMRFAILVSGEGSTLQSLIDAERAGQLAPAEIALALSDRPDAYALQRARAAGKPTSVVPWRAHRDRRAFDHSLIAELRAHAIDAVVLAGFMRLLGRAFVDAFQPRIINVHPSLLPAFPGLHAPRQAIEHGVKVTGATVHFVDYGMDTGPIIAQACVPVFDDDDAHSLHQRIRVEERKLLRQAVVSLARGALSRYGRVVRHMPPDTSPDASSVALRTPSDRDLTAT